MSEWDWVYPVVFTILVVISGAGALAVWRSGSALISFVVTLPLALLILLDALAIWYDASGGLH
jgi:hypothetical protein